MDTEKKETGIVDKVWKFFSSVTLAVIVFSIISVTSIVGTIIEQQAEPERNIKLLAKFFGESAAPSIYKALDAMNFTDMFNSWWFLALLFIFAANLIICSIDRLPRIWKIVREPVKPIREEQFKSCPKKELVIKASADKAEQSVIEALKKMGFGHSKKDSGQIFAEKGRYSRLGVYVTHLSILFILIGAVIGMKFGFNAGLNLLEGTSSRVAYKSNGQEFPLGFEIRCDDFDVSFYPDSERPKEFKSWLTVIDQGREVMKKEIEVNSPLRYKGITFYQSSYGFTPNKDAVFKFTVTASNGKSEDIGVKFGQPFAIPGTGLTGVVADFSPALGVDEQGRLFTYAEAMVNPAVFIEVSGGGKAKFRQWILRRFPETWKTAAGNIEFKDLWGVQYTGLQVRKDPGVWVVYLGCVIMALGLYAAFFMSHARIWIKLNAEKGGTRLTIASSINKNRIAFDRKIEKMMADLEGKG